MMKPTDKELIEQRLAGILPTIEIKGHPFIIDWRFKELRPKDDFAARPIRLRELPMNDDGNAYICHYFPDTHQGIAPDPYMKEIPVGSLLIEIPYELKLDPVAVARQYGMQDTELLESFPIQRDLKATVIPWRDSGFAHLLTGQDRRGTKTKKRRGNRM